MAIEDVAQSHHAIMPAVMFVNSHNGLPHHVERERQVIGYAKRLADLEGAGADSVIGIAETQIK